MQSKNHCHRQLHLTASGEKKKASKKHGIKEYFATLWSDGTENQKLRGGGGKLLPWRCSWNKRNSSKSLKKKNNLYVTSEGIFFYLPRLHHGKKTQTNHPKQNNLKSYTCLMTGYRRKVWQNKRTAGALMNLQTGPRSSVSALTAEERHYGTRPGCRDSWILSSKAHYYWTLFLSHWIKNYTLIYIKLWYRWTINHVDISAWHKNTEVKSIQLTCSLKKQANKRTDEVSRVSPGMTV